MHQFLYSNRAELISRCEAKVARRPRRSATPEQLKNGVPLFLDQLIKTLRAESEGRTGASLRISGAAGGDVDALSEIGVSASAHGKQLLELGYTVNQVVHDYGDLCQAVTDLAVERDAPFTVDAFRTMNRCLDNAIADAVTEFSEQRDLAVFRRHSAQAAERLGFFVHEVRNALHTATLATAALQAGGLPIAGATGGVLQRSLIALTALVDRTIEEARAGGDANAGMSEVFSIAAFMAEAGNAALLEANARGCPFTLRNADSHLEVAGHRELLLAALANLIHNALKFTRPFSEVTLSASAGAGAVFIDVEDHCGGLPPGAASVMFKPFTQHHPDTSGLGLGLSIAQRNVELAGGALSVRDVPGTGCVFTIRLPLHQAIAGDLSPVHGTANH